MKKIIAIITLAATVSSAQTWQSNIMPVVVIGARTNLSVNNYDITVPSAGITNAPCTVTKTNFITIGEESYNAFGKINTNVLILAGQICGLQTNQIITVTSTITGAAGTPASVTNLGSGNVVTLQFTVPRGLDGTNGLSGTNGVNGVNGAPGNGTNYVATIFTNTVLSSHYFTQMASNNFVFTGSNYLGSFSQLQSWYFILPSAGGHGLTPGTNSIENLYGSTNGGSTWFIITNAAPAITNTILLAAVGDSNSAPGNVFIQGIDHPELVGRTNFYDGQLNQFPDAVNPLDVVNLETLNLILGNKLNGQFVASISNGVLHSTLSESGVPVIDIASPSFTLPSSLSVSGQNLLLKIASTNFVVGWKITASTNLSALYSWANFTNYTVATNSGIVTFTIPKPASTTYFFWPQGPALNSITFTPPVGMLGGAYYPSNTWSLYSVTNGMGNMSFSDVNSNGLTMTRVYLSNGVPWCKALWP